MPYFERLVKEFEKSEFLEAGESAPGGDQERAVHQPATGEAPATRHAPHSGHDYAGTRHRVKAPAHRTQPTAAPGDTPPTAPATPKPPKSPPSRPATTPPRRHPGTLTSPRTGGSHGPVTVLA